MNRSFAGGASLPIPDGETWLRPYSAELRGRSAFVDVSMGSNAPTTDALDPAGKIARSSSGKDGLKPRLQLHQRDTGTIRSKVPYLLRDQTQSMRWPMHILPVDRALSIYGALADRSETKGARERLSKHLMQLYIEGEKNEHRLTVHGLSYLRELDRENDSRN
jgi:hypothetical protein